MVKEHIDTIELLMARCVAGSLPEPAQVLVQSHLALKNDNRAYVRDLEAMAGLALDEIEPASFSDGERDQALQAIFGSQSPADSPIRLSPSPAADEKPDAIFPKVLRDYVGFDADQVPWRSKMPGFREYDLGERDGCFVSLFWIKPGRMVPAHTHEGCEISLVLDGAFSDQNGRFGRGDISVADDTIDHRPMAEKGRPCIGFAVTDAPLKLTGSFHQMIRDLIG